MTNRKAVACSAALGLAVSLLGCASAPPESTCPVPEEAMISDFETGLGSIALEQDRGSSGWYVYNDETPGSKQEPKDGQVYASEGGACNTRFALRTAGSGFSVWGAGVGTDLAVDRFNTKTTYDASGYQGVRFWARTALSSQSVRLKVQDVNTTPEFGICDDAANACNNNFGATIMLGTDWQEFKIPFAEMEQEAGWGDQFPAIAADQLVGIQFQAPKGAMDFWVDEVSFF